MVGSAATIWDAIGGRQQGARQTTMSNADLDRDFAALECMRRARMCFEARICDASTSRDEDVLERLRLDSMYEFAEFYFTLSAMGLTGREDIGLVSEMHDQRILALLKDTQAMRQRRLSKERLLEAIFTSDTRPRLEQFWRDAPGSLDQSNLARFLLPQMSQETSRKLIGAAEEAGFLRRRKSSYGPVVVQSTGVMEQVFGQCLREMRLAIAAL